MSNVKMSLIMDIPGGKLMSEEEAKRENAYNSFGLKIHEEKGKKEKWSYIVVKTRQARTVQQTIEMDYSAYKFMLTTPVNEKYNPNPRNKAQWLNLPIMERLRKHCQEIADDFGAKSFRVEVYND